MTNAHESGGVQLRLLRTTSSINAETSTAAAAHVVALGVKAAVGLDPFKRVVHQSSAAARVARGAVAVYQLLRVANWVAPDC